jgi:putative ABC transport system permease protein
MEPSNHYPPKRAEQLLEWLIRDELAEEVLGDLEEKFFAVLEKKSPFRAKLNYWYQVFHYLRPFAIRRKQSTHLIPVDMYRHYFKISWRNLLKKRLYSFINISGLAIGLTCFLMIFLFVQHETSYDQSFKDGDRIYHIIQQQKGNVYLGTDYFGVTPSPLARALEEDYPEVLHATSVSTLTTLLGYEDKNYWEKGIWADSGYFPVFKPDFIAGSAHSAFELDNSVVLTLPTAEKIFGDQNPIGKTLLFEGEEEYIVTGVVAAPPRKASIQYSYIRNIQSNSDYNRQTWNNNSYHTFFLLSEKAAPEALQAKLTAIFDKYKVYNENYPFEDTYFVKSLASLHLQDNVNFDIGKKGNPQYVYLFSAIGIIVLLLACVNYMNLAVARSINRAKEVGMRKVIGAVKQQLVGQFLSESVLVAFLALMLAILMTRALLPFFNQVLETDIQINFQENPYLLPGLAALIFLVGLISGSYPAIYMAALRPIEVLKGKLKNSASGMKVQKLLIVVQYAVSVILIAGSITIYLQLDFMQEKEMGYDKDHIITIRVTDSNLPDKYETLRQDLLKNPNIVETTASIHLPTNIGSSTIINDEEDNDPSNDLAIYSSRVDENYLEVFGIELLWGRNFSTDGGTDRENGYIINETAARALDWEPEEALGKQFDDQGMENVIGVIKDFHLHSLHLPIHPLMLRLDNSFIRFISVKVHPQELPETIAFLESTFKKYSPYPFDYQFLDENFDQLYKSEAQMGGLFSFFTMIALLIASLGLFGLAAFSIEQKTQEIGIRKVLGASVRQIVAILAKDFLQLVIFAFVVAVPIAWYGMNQWLEDFAYHIEIEWWIFAFTFAMILSITALTISYQSIRAARLNPVDSLRSE